MRLFKNSTADLTTVQNLVIDIDDTIWIQPGADEDEEREYQAFAALQGLSPEQLRGQISRKKAELKRRHGRKFSMYEILLKLGISPNQLTQIRCSIYQPERWIKQPDAKLCEALAELSQVFRIAFGTNSPVPVGERVVELLGLRKLC